MGVSSTLSVLCVICLSLLPHSLVHSKDCVLVDQCKCTFDDGSGTVDLSNIGSTDATNPFIRDVFAADNFAYSFNPCYPFNEGTCVNAAGCQVDTNNNVYYNIGDSSKVSFSYDGLNVIGTYVADDGARSSIVTFTCDPNVDPPSYQVNGETAATQYSFQVTSKYACAQGGDSPGPHVIVTVTASISVGTVLTIGFFSVVIIYIVAGVLFMKLRRHETGKQVIPNVTFWSSVPGLAKDGCMFVVSKITRRPMEYSKI